MKGSTEVAQFAVCGGDIVRCGRVSDAKLARQLQNSKPTSMRIAHVLPLLGLTLANEPRAAVTHRTEQLACRLLRCHRGCEGAQWCLLVFSFFRSRRRSEADDGCGHDSRTDRFRREQVPQPQKIPVPAVHPPAHQPRATLEKDHAESPVAP